MTKRFNVSVTEWQAAALEEIAAQQEVSVSHVIRTALRDQLPRLLALARFLEDPAADPDFALDVVNFMDLSERRTGVREFDTHEPGFELPTADERAQQFDLQWGGLRAPELPPWLDPEEPEDPLSPPPGNTGAHR
jgi:hypothetical protein